MPKSKTIKKAPPPPPSLKDEGKLADQEVRRKRIKEALILTENNRKQAAERLNCRPRTFYHWLHELDLLTWKLSDEPELVAQVLSSQGGAK